jgi:hypothetical protein
MSATIPSSVAALGEGYVRLWAQFSEFPTRAEVSAHIRVFKPRSLANMDCQGRGPAGRLLCGGKVCYPRDQVVIWFASLVESPKSRFGQYVDQEEAAKVEITEKELAFVGSLLVSDLSSVAPLKTHAPKSVSGNV